MGPDEQITNEELDEDALERAASPVVPPSVEQAIVEPPKVKLPICRVCQGELDTLTTLDYEHLTVVIHERNGCVVGVLYAK